MSWGTCYSGSNNIHFNYPALMSDGKQFTNWNTACTTNNALINQNNIQTNYQYRQYLINHGNQVLVQDNAGFGAGFENSDYEKAGAKIVKEASDIFNDAEMIIKVKTI